MAPSFDSAVSSLLCAEDDNSVFDDNDFCGAVLGEFESKWNHRFYRNFGQNEGFDSGEQLPLQSEEFLALMVEKEQQHLPNADYLTQLRSGDLDLEARMEAVDWIEKAHAHFGFGPLCEYLSINYLDRFLSAYELPKGKAWMMQLLAVACLSLAAKMEETEVPLSLDLQVAESKFMFEARTIQRMELLVLSTLSWRMQAVTPFSFLDYFIRKLNNDQISLRTSISRLTKLTLSTIRGIDFLEFKPSEIAAAVAICVAGESKAVDTEKAISLLSQYVQKERVLKVVELLQDLPLGVGSKGASVSVPSVPQSPIGVLDAASLSYKSDGTTVGSCTSSSHSTPDTKRRKLNRPCGVEL